jgi:uncharacterized protein (TIGR01777 family)
VSQAEAFEYHARPGALNRLVPPWEAVEIVRSANSILPGSEVLLRANILGKKLDWLARHDRYEPPYAFSDLQVYGPFASWYHTHSFVANETNRCTLEDQIDYELPLGALGKFFGSGIASKKLDAMFGFRHRQTSEDLSFGNNLLNFTNGESKTIAVSGCNGLIGKSVCSLLTVLGHRIIKLDRALSQSPSDATTSSELPTDMRGTVSRTPWDPKIGLARPNELEGIDAVIHLAGKGIGDSRWSESVRKELIASRIDATQKLASQLAGLKDPPKAFVSASGVGIYGSIGASIADEQFPVAGDFLGNLAQDWESASASLDACGTRRCVGRLGIVLDPQSGALAKLLPVVRWGVGGSMGSGAQYWSWIAKEDAASGFVWLALNPNCSGPFNFVGGAETNREFTQTLASLLHRPALLPAPSFALKIALGEMADSLLLASTNASNQKLLNTGFRFRSLDLKDAFRHILGLVHL